MNRLYATLLVAVILGSIGLFQIVVGLDSLRRRNRSSRWGWFRFVFGLATLLSLYFLYQYFKSAQA